MAFKNKKSEKKFGSNKCENAENKENCFPMLLLKKQKVHYHIITSDSKLTIVVFQDLSMDKMIT